MVFLSSKCCCKARLDGKTAIVTGSNRGIGKHIAMDLCKRVANTNFEDITYENHIFIKYWAYFKSKLALVLFTKELSRRIPKNVNVYAVHPGWVSTGIVTGWFAGLVWKIIGWFVKTPEQGAQTIIHCAVDEKVAQESGYYYENCKVEEMNRTGNDPELAKKLWDLSVNWVGLQTFDPFGQEDNGQVSI